VTAVVIARSNNRDRHNPEFIVLKVNDPFNRSLLSLYFSFLLITYMFQSCPKLWRTSAKVGNLATKKGGG
jgi:hypothetical protein